MNGPRAALIGMLVGAEVLIAGFAIWVLGGSHLPAIASGFHEVDSKPVTFAPMDLGPAPHVVVADPDSRVVVKPSTDGKLHVSDMSAMHGYVAGDSSVPKLRVTRTADGARIERAASGDEWGHWTIGFSMTERQIEVDLPAASRVEIEKSSGADVTGIGGGVSVRSQDGSIALADLKGAVDAESADGAIAASNVTATSLSVSSADGRLTLRNVSAESLDASTSDGRIEASGLTIAGAHPRASLSTRDGSIELAASFAPGGSYDVNTADGRVALALAPGADLVVDASTADGSIDVDGTHYEGDDAAQHTVRLGAGSGTLRVSSGDGSIHLTTNGAS
ncbi:MAG TPA: DUF4097 family beta strand repeat-containing protein [Verrucomicrobiae bacterium]|nr:DUF4097 family beta strand repeat-containing protein [Verrucomicrobiae bacterium]